jgi:uncharacterized membrane protein
MGQVRTRPLAMGSFTSFNVTNDANGPGGTVAFGINDGGQIVGDYLDMGGVRHGFLRDSAGNYTTLDPPGSSLTVAEGINNSGVIVGLYFDGSKQHGFVLSGGMYTPINIPGAMSTEINSINAKGQIVGQYNDKAGTMHGFVGTPETPFAGP